MNITFKDLFSKQAALYAKYRPTYPDELFDLLAAITPSHARAWDCATGNGQAARALTRHFGHVTATDASAEQIRNAEPHAKVSYQVASAEESGLPAGAFDLVTAATAAHWFDLPRFYAEAKRVLKPGGVLAIWTYGGNETEGDAEVEALIKRYSREMVGPYWAPELKKLHQGYKALEFPFQEIEAPPFSIRAEWDQEQLLGYLLTWSSTQRYIEATGQDPRELIREDLAKAWGNPGRKILREWKIDMRVGRV